MPNDTTIYIQELKKALLKVAGDQDFHLEVPTDDKHGDYSTNIALQMGGNPRNNAEMLLSKLQKDEKLSEIVAKIEIAGPGFINFFLKDATLIGNLENIYKEADDFGKSDLLNGQKIMFEFGQPNTHKLPHIGHLFSYILGSSMSNLLESTGAQVMRVNYQGDVGPHVAKCLWAFQKENPDVSDDLAEKVNMLQKMYQLGSKKYEEDENAKAEIDNLNVQIYKKDKAIEKLYQETRGWCVDYYKQFEKRIGIVFKRYYFESEVQDLGRKMVLENTPKVFKKSKGAFIFEGSKHDLHDRVFVTSKNTPTYEAKDLSLENLKMDEWPADLLVISTANEQNEYFKVVFKALETLNPKRFVGKLKHVGFGMVQLKEGKLSSRKGSIIGGIDLVDLVVEKAEKLSGGDADIAEKVGIGAIKYSFLSSSPEKNVSFNINESISIQGNSGPYLQYTFARTQSVLAKSKKAHKNLSGSNLNNEELTLLRTFIHFPEVVAEAAVKYAPNLLCNYLFNLAQKYNTLYNEHKIIAGDNEDLRLAITFTTGQILKNGLTLLGIQAPNKM